MVSATATAINTAAEFPDPRDPVHRAASAHKTKVRDAWRDLAKHAGATASGAETFADCYAALVEGALTMRQSYGRDDAARAVRPAVEQLVRAYLPAVRERAGPNVSA